MGQHHVKLRLKGNSNTALRFSSILHYHVHAQPPPCLSLRVHFEVRLTGGAVLEEGSIAEIFIAVGPKPSTMEEDAGLAGSMKANGKSGENATRRSNATLGLDSFQWAAHHDQQPTVLGMTVAVIGVPGGLELRFDRLREVGFRTFYLC